MIDSFNAIAELASESMPFFLSSLLGPRTTVAGVFHLDVPVLTTSTSPYAPSPLTLLRYLSTTVLTVYSLPQQIAQKAARDKSLVEPGFGLAEGIEGVIVGLGANDIRRGVVVEMDYRRKSGRGVREWFVLQSLSPASRPSGRQSHTKLEPFVRLRDYPPYQASERPMTEQETSRPAHADFESTFNLDLSEKQRQDRDKVVLPYFDAQQAQGGIGEGGRILYQMGVEDDFDDEEDEI